MSNSASNPAWPFFERFRSLWRAGRGRGVLTAKRLGHVADEQWNVPEFCDALGRAGANGKEEMVPRWRDGRNVPRRPQMDAILRVFFTTAGDGGTLRFDPGHAECEQFLAVWTQAFAARQGRTRKPALQALSNLPEDWWLEGGHEFPDLVTFRTFQPTPVEAHLNRYDVPANLTFGTAQPEDPEGTAIQLELSLRTAWLEIPVTSYQPSPDLMVGDSGRNHRFVERTNGRHRIKGPMTAEHLRGDTFSNETVASVEPGQRRGGPLALRITAPMTEIDATGKAIVDGVTADVTRDKSQVLKLLLQKGCRVDDTTGRVILAERLLTRKPVRK